jgi:signal transduction histidine kinase
MAERAERIGASLEVFSKPGHGTSVVLTLPLDANDRPRAEPGGKSNAASLESRALAATMAA